MKQLLNKNIKKILHLLIAISSLTVILYAGDTVKIMPLGDSITYGNNYYNPPNTETQVSYRKPLWEGLDTAGYSIDFVGWQESGTDFPPFDPDHQGHPGATALEIAGEIYTYLEINEPEVVLLHIGTNELRTDTADVEYALNEIDRYENDKNVHIQVILARIINRWVGWDDPDDTNRTTAEHETNTTIFNNDLQSMADTRIAKGDDIIMVNMETESGISYDSTDMADDLHPNDAGYAKMANIWLGALQTTLPTHLWKFDELDGVTSFVDTSRDNNGTCIGAGCPQSTQGILGSNARLFDGNDEVTVNDDNTFDWSGSDSFTIEFWIKPTRTDGDNQVVVGRENEAKDNFFWWAGIDGSNGRVTFRLRDDSGSDSIKLDGPVLNAEEWHHVVCIRDGANNQNIMYVNGGNVSITATYAGNFNGTTPVNVGYDYTNRSHLDSTIDELTIYNGAMNAAQAKQHYERGIVDFLLAITTTPITLANVGSSYLYDVNSTMDPTTTFDYTAIPDLSWMGIDADTGEISSEEMVTNEFIGNVDMNVTATNGSQTATQDYVLKVRNPDSLPDGMSHYWKFDENETTDTRTYIDSYAGADGTCTGTDCPEPRQGRVNGAQSFTGANKIDVSDTSSFDWAADASFTIEYWIRVDSGTDISKNMIVIGRDGSSSKFTWWAGIIHDTGHAFFLLRDSNGGASSVQSSHSTVGDNTTGHHVAIVRNGNTGEISLYLDGNPEETKNYTFTGSFSESSAPAVNIGYLNLNGTPGYFLNNGTSGIDDLVIFDKAMSAPDINNHFKNSSAGKSFEELPPAPEPVPSNYTRANNMVTDHNRGLQWQDDPYTSADENAYNSLTVESGKAKKWIHAADYCSNLALEGNGWRLPTIDELNTIVDTDRADPAMNLIFVNALGMGTWSGTTYADNTSQAWGIGFQGGGWHHCTKDTKSKLIRCVREFVDTTAPIITLLGTTPIDVEQGSTYNDAGASATDDIDGNITANIVTVNGVDVNTVGTYTVTYDVSDTAGNATDTVTRTVTVTATADVTKPVILMTGSDVSIELDNAYTDAGATAADNIDGNITANIVTVNSVNENAVGTYTVTYDVSDTAGNAADTVTRTVTVSASTTPPVNTSTPLAPVYYLLF